MTVPASANGHRARLRQRFLVGGARAFLDHEIIEMLLAHVQPRGDTKALAHALIAAISAPTKSGSTRPSIGAGVAAVLRDPLSVYVAKTASGFGGGMAVHMEAVREAASRIAQTSHSDAPLLGSWNAVGAYCRQQFAGFESPAIAMLLLDYRHRLLADPVLFAGEPDTAAITHTGITTALRHGASGLIVVRLSPGGQLTDTPTDHALARSVRDAGAPVSVLMHDYIIIAADTYMSLRSMGVLEVAPAYETEALASADPQLDGWYAEPEGSLATLQERVAAGEVGLLPDTELLSLLLRRTTSEGARAHLPADLILRFGNLGRLLSTPIDELLYVLRTRDSAIRPDNIESAAVQLGVIGEAAQRLLRAQILDAPPLEDMPALVRYCRAALAYGEVEQLHALFLTADSRLLWDEVLSRGTVNTAPVQPREIASRGLRLGARSIVLVHNHPTGDPEPSQADISMTLQVDQACHSVGIRVVDHIVIAETGHASLAETGRMPRLAADWATPHRVAGAQISGGKRRR
jgi:DNA repair protein RadC